MIVLDTSGLVAALVQSEPRHEACLRAFTEADRPLLLSPFVLAECDYLLSTMAGVDAELGLLADVAAGRYDLIAVDHDVVDDCHRIASRYRDLGLGLADASVVALADRFATRNVLTLDERRFRAVTGSDGTPFRLLPADA